MARTGSGAQQVVCENRGASCSPLMRTCVCHVFLPVLLTQLACLFRGLLLWIPTNSASKLGQETYPRTWGSLPA